MFRTVVGVVALVLACGALVARQLAITNHVVLIVAALAPVLLLGAPLAAVLLVSVNSRLVVVSVAVTLIVAATVLPLYRGRPDVPVNPSVVRMMSANIYAGFADMDDVVDSARAHADVLAVQELTPSAVTTLSADGIDAVFPYRWLDPRDGASGSGLWSRFPLHDARYLDGFTMSMLSARVRLPDSDLDPTVLVVHVGGPWPQPIDEWRRDLDRLPATLDRLATEADSGAVIVAGDFNSSTDMRPFRALLRNGFRDAAEQSAAGYLPTYPANRVVPPLIAIDHILTRNCTATSLRTVSISGSDHLGIVSSLSVGTRASSPRRAGPPG